MILILELFFILREKIYYQPRFLEEVSLTVDVSNSRVSSPPLLIG